MLNRLNTNLERAGISLNLSDIKGRLMPHLDAANLGEQISGEIFFTADRAMKHFAKELLAEAEAEAAANQSTFTF